MFLLPMLLAIPLILASVSTQFTVLMFNDVYEIHPRKDGLGGFSPFNMLLKEERKKCKHHVTTLNGDILFPSVLSTFDRAVHRIKLFNMMDLDLVVLGNHEFDFGPEVLKKRIDESNFLWLGANVYNLEGEHFTGKKQTHIIEIDGVKIGFFGICTNDTPILSSTDNSVLFCPLTLTAQRMVDELRAEGVDIVVALTHLYINEDRMLAKEVKGIDLILGGHDHDPIMWYEQSTLLMKAGQNAYFLGRIDLDITKDDDGKVSFFPSWKIIANKGYPSDPEMDAVIAVLDEKFDSSTSEPLGITESELDTRYEMVREKEARFGNFVADVMRDELNADVAIFSGGMIRGNNVYPEGFHLTYRDLLNELPFDNKVALLELRGIDIIEALENGFSQVGEYAGRFPQVSGLEIFFNASRPIGKRIIEVNVNGDPLNPKALYRLATVDYNARGGDGYHNFTNGNLMVPPDEGGGLVDLLSKHIMAKGKIAPKLEERITSITFHSRLLDNKKETRK